jgi:regulator of protease activity HflC (stomatin/prohibitin superfamily)
LRSIIGQSQLDELLSERDKINLQLQDILDKQTAPWGIKGSLVETKQADLDTEMQRAIARQAEAERGGPRSSMPRERPRQQSGWLRRQIL